jgi:8-oxo-dGTP pyrophosphatase MutT (NUDIX family)
MGAGVLPVALYKGTLFLLLGQERSNNLWCDFGGSPHRGEKPYKTAIREGSEELNGFLGDENDFETYVSNNFILSITFDRYTSYIFRTIYDKKLPQYFTNVNNFAELHLKDKIDTQHNGLFEKKQIQWFPLSKFKEGNSRSMFREHYKPLLESVLKNELFIIKYIETMNQIT